MYEAFDSFLKVGTWHTTHPKDDERFYLALREVVLQRDFSPEKMREYFQEKVGLGDDESHPTMEAITRRYHQAETIADYARTIAMADPSFRWEDPL